MYSVLKNDTRIINSSIFVRRHTKLRAADVSLDELRWTDDPRRIDYAIFSYVAFPSVVYNVCRHMPSQDVVHRGLHASRSKAGSYSLYGTETPTGGTLKTSRTRSVVAWRHSRTRVYCTVGKSRQHVARTLVLS